MISPTGKGIRQDPMGDGHYGAKRGKRRHDGVDYCCDVGQPILQPISGVIEREAKPYASSDLSGVIIRGDHMVLKMFYFKPHEKLIGRYVSAGEEIGIAQDVSAKHGHHMFPHIHLEITSMNPDVFINDFRTR